MDDAGYCDGTPEIVESLENTVQTPSEDAISPDDSCNDTAPNEVFVDSLIANIFGDTSDNEDGPKEGTADDIVLEEGPKFEFDRIQERRKRERAKRRRQCRSEAIGVATYIEEEVERVVELMRKAAIDDRESNLERRPAIEKVKLLPVVKRLLLRADYYEALLESEVMAAIADWLAPLPDRSLPSFDVRSTLLEIVSRWTRLESTILKQSGLGKTIMMLSNHPKECQRNRGTTSKLVRAWSLPILQSADYNEEGGKVCDSGRKRRRQGGNADGSTVVPSKVAKTVPLSVCKTPSNTDFFQVFDIKR